MTEPTSMEEFNRKFVRNQTVTGYGPETTVHFPCPFCAEPDFMVHLVLNTSAAYREGAVCKHCHRGMKAIIKSQPSSVEFTFVQTEGPDAPSWMYPKIPRMK